MVQAITATYVQEDDDWSVTVAGEGKSLHGRAPGIIAARDRADQLVEKLTEEGRSATVVHLLNGSALEFTSAYMTARLSRAEPAEDSAETETTEADETTGTTEATEAADAAEAPQSTETAESTETDSAEDGAAPEGGDEPEAKDKPVVPRKEIGRSPDTARSEQDESHADGEPADMATASQGVRQAATG
ncbi:hypothetical protein B0I33_103341 [Prauserella shujinwangii]|uniref:DUF2188 domain-containing protein n=1 Tax=Prauserella shujinwangii TaxID=1453103 RepID=A0A2T0LYV4_9PSEU|nr:hypothetical protein [Prauserella shujinwangii]PRX49306.1 hypothetical protein B0I33_103341 [Prauserella shujinwangii]